jgi:hypothetical protein
MTSAEANALHNPFITDGRFRHELQVDCKGQKPDVALLQRASVSLAFPNQEWINLAAQVGTISALFIDRPSAKDLSPISEMNLFHLSLSYPSRVKDWRFVRNLASLKRLSLHNTLSIQDIEEVGALSHLEVFQLSGGYSKSLQLPSLWPLAKCRPLVAVLLAAVRFTDYSLQPLLSLPSLQRFDCPMWWPANELQSLCAHNKVIGSNAIQP